MVTTESHHRYAIHLTADTELPRRDQPHILRIGTDTKPARESTDISTTHALSARDLPSQGGDRKKITRVQNNRAWEEERRSQESAMRPRRLLGLWETAG